MKKLTILLILVKPFHECFAERFIILIHFYSLFLLDSLLGFPALVSCILLKPVIWLLLQLNWLVSMWCKIWVWGFSRQITNIFIWFYICVYICVYMYVCFFMHMYMYVYSCICISVYIYVYLYVYIYIHIYIMYMYICIY